MATFISALPSPSSRASRVFVPMATLAAAGLLALGASLRARTVNGIASDNAVTDMGLRVAERKRGPADARLRTAMQMAPGPIYAKDRRGRIIMANAALLERIGEPWSDAEGRTDRELLDVPVQAEQVMANDQGIVGQGGRREFEEAGHRAESGARIWSSVKTPLRDETATVIGAVGVSPETTVRKRVEDRLHLVVDALNRRVKNTLATVQALASQTLRGADPALLQTLEGRLVALASARDVLMRESAAPDDVVADALEPFGGRESGGFDVSGPPLRLAPRAALALALGLHGLITNAVNHGVLFGPPGRVGIAWDVTRGPNPLFRLRWAERGGPTVAAPPRLGFGIRLIERSLAQDLGGTAAVSFGDPRGVVGLVEAPLAKVAASAEVLPLLRVGPRA